MPQPNTEQLPSCIRNAISEINCCNPECSVCGQNREQNDTPTQNRVNITTTNTEINNIDYTALFNPIEATMTPEQTEEPDDECVDEQEPFNCGDPSCSLCTTNGIEYRRRQQRENPPPPPPPRPMIDPNSFNISFTRTRPARIRRNRATEEIVVPDVNTSEIAGYNKE